MKYCNTCILPSSRPNIYFDENGSCCASKSEKKIQINWEQREATLQKLAAEIKAMNAPYDCVIPVSGGKDSTWQVIKVMELGLKPLCVTWKTTSRTELGAKNLSNLISLGVDHIDFTINPIVERKLSKISFYKTGIPALPMHLALFAIPTRVAINFKIPIIIWGENGAFEFGGTEEDGASQFLTRDWLLRYGVSSGTFADDWISDELSASDLQPYLFPSDDELHDSGTRAIFLGQFLKWDPRLTFKIAKEHGFTAAPKPLLGSYEFADIDEAFIMPVHHWIKWHKFGFTRTWDNLSIDIRLNKITRDQAINKIKEIGFEEPTEAIKQYCEYLGITLDDFHEVCNSFRDSNIWSKNNEGFYCIKDFLIEDWVWNEA
jgi:N-acetyl sugar amidotransferase